MGVMREYVLLLRGINVGGRRRVAMADLRRLLSEMGFAGVRTCLQSGNAVFGAPDAQPAALASAVEARIRTDLGLDVRCLVRSGAQLRAALDANPLAHLAEDGAKMIALFLSAAPEPQRLAADDPAQLAPGRIAVRGDVVYHWCPDGVLAAPDVGAFVERRLGLTATARNWNTLTRLAAMLGA